MAAVDDRRKQRYLEIAQSVVGDAKLDDFLQFLTVQRLAGDSPTARFYDAYPVSREGDKVVGGGRTALLEDLKAAAVPTSVGDETPVTTATVMRLLGLVDDLRAKDPSAIGGLREIVREDFEGYFVGPKNRSDTEAIANDVMLNLMFAAAHTDEGARERLARFYGAITAEYGAAYTALLLVLDREPIPAVGSVERLAAVITALFDGLAIRERIDETGLDLLMGVLFPIVAALTIPVGSEPATPAELLFGEKGSPPAE